MPKRIIKLFFCALGISEEYNTITKGGLNGVKTTFIITECSIMPVICVILKLKKNPYAFAEVLRIVYYVRSTIHQ